MTKKEIIEKNIGMTFDFIRFLIENPKKIKDVPDNAELQFIDKDFPIEEKIVDKKVVLYRASHIFEPI